MPDYIILNNFMAIKSTNTGNFAMGREGDTDI
jgi:hypothetical protein